MAGVIKNREPITSHCDDITGLSRYFSCTDDGTGHMIVLIFFSCLKDSRYAFIKVFKYLLLDFFIV